MKTIVINNQKGGVGKTMLAVHLAWYLAEQELQGGKETRVLVIDLDGQGNASSVLSEEREVGKAADLFDSTKELPTEGKPGISTMVKDARLHSIEMSSVPQAIRRFQVLQDGYDYCVIDTPPTWGARNFAAMAVSDFLIAPIEMKGFALNGIKDLLASIDVVEKKARGGRTLVNLGLLPSRFNSHSAEERKRLQEALDSLGDRLMFPGAITLRDSYEAATALQMPVWRLPTSHSVKAASGEMRRVLDIVNTRLDPVRVVEAA